MYFSFDLFFNILYILNNVEIEWFKFTALFLKQGGTVFIREVDFFEHVGRVDACFSVEILVFVDGFTVVDGRVINVVRFMIWGL